MPHHSYRAVGDRAPHDPYRAVSDRTPYNPPNGTVYDWAAHDPAYRAAHDVAHHAPARGGAMHHRSDGRRPVHGRGRQRARGGG